MTNERIADRYELIEPVSSGGMGSVWRGFDSVLDREVAVKLIRADSVGTPEQADEFVARFRREARVTARIQHQGIPQVYDAVLDDSVDRVYLVMELVRGKSLRAYLDEAVPRPVDWVVAVTAQICTALSHAHAIPVVHRDLKPDNIIVADDGVVKIIDFGIAAILRSDTTKLTATGVPMGTSRYMAPEQIKGAPVTPLTDLYALGCIVHELLTGTTPFREGTEFEVWQQHLGSPPPSTRAIRPDVPVDLDALVLDLLRKNPQLRPADALTVYRRLYPLLPAPEMPGSDDDRPDPTAIYRHPYAPRAAPHPQRPVAPPVTPAAQPTDAELNAAIDAGLAAANALLDEERFAQAAQLLQQIVEDTARRIGPDHPRVLRLRLHRAAVLLLGADYQRALPEFDSLTEAFTRAEGQASRSASECRLEAAHCRAEIGDSAGALEQFRDLLADLHLIDGDATELMLDVRRNIGVLLAVTGDTTGAQDMLESLLADLRVIYGPEHNATQEVVTLLARLRATSPS